MAAAVAWLILRHSRTQLAWLLLLPRLYLLPDVPAPERGDASAVLVQPNISDDTVWSDDLLDATGRQLTLASLGPVLADRGKTDLIVWPEVPAPFYDYDPRFTRMVSRIAKTAHAALLTGVVARAADNQPLNSALLVGPDGNFVSRYDKVHLVPFGEYVPWPLGAISKKVSTEAGDFEAGRGPVVSSIDGHRLGTFICYESVYPAYVRQFVQSGAQVLLNISNDEWFGKSEARQQHLGIVRMRAAENHRWILRSTNNGITAAIDPAGRVVRAADEYQEVSARFPFRYREDTTVYTRFGDWFVVVCAAVVLAASLW
jgi:apolipoprotein N-acyltransferase